MKVERWGSPLVQEKYREEKACDKRHPFRTMMMMMMMMMILLLLLLIIIIIIMDRNITQNEAETKSKVKFNV